MIQTMAVCHSCGAELADKARFCAQCGAASAIDANEDSLIGRVIGGAYRIEEIIGVGGMGRVYKATQTMLGRTVAIKVIHPHLLGDESSVARFYTEARAASRMNHPNSVSIIDFGRTDDGILHLVMEYLHGRDLATVMQEEGPLDFLRICRILEGVLAALAEAHELSVVHRDLKPENILLQKQRKGGDFVKVVDFGLAKILEPTATSVTTPGLVCGTPDYMAPEQARGEEVDGRGDIYAVGVLLFELLTERLPYEDETPTKVALRHLIDPVPDPRKLAPQRHIPDALAELCMKALQKKREQRPATADEMASQIRKIGDSLAKEEDKRHSCPSCGAATTVAMKYCGDCGVRLGGPVSSVQPAYSLRPAMSLPPVMDFRGRLVGRTAELEQFEALRSEAKNRLITMRFVGDVGMGKTRLLSEIADRSAKLGDAVVAAGPHPTGVPVPYSTTRALVAGLMGLLEKELGTLLQTSKVFEDPLANAGLQELVTPTGVSGLDGRSRAGAVAFALAAAVRFACSRTASGRVVLLIDDVQRCDGLSQQVLEKFATFAEDVSLLVVLASDPASAPVASDGVVTIPLRGLVEAEANQLLSGTFRFSSMPQSSSSTEDSGFSPMFLEQMRYLGMVTWEEGQAPRISDMIMQRIERLEVSARRVLQAAAVLGERFSKTELETLVGTHHMERGLETLLRSELLVMRNDDVQISHPFVRDLVEASIPAAARMSLHSKALQIASANDAPLEVRAEHAYRAGEFMSAMVLLEQMGGAALARGNAQTAVYAFRHGLELARRELWETGDDSLDKAIVGYSRKLGEAMEQQGDFSGAYGVLREALDLAGPTNVERARMLNVLGRVSARRDRRRDAMRLLGMALDIAERAQSDEVCADTQIAICRVRLAEGDQIGAANALRRALDYLQESTSERQTEILVRLAEVLIDVGDVEEASSVLEKAADNAKHAHFPALLASVYGVMATLDELSGNPQLASQRYREASLQAANAGDADAYFRWRRASTTLKAAANQ